ncbi:hypothetical protein [uncultured Pontibacter sp.]|uniref:hypothetical protein n=1 Tax=uncultured Pontibacter sp. TaxID=453356 RepID=UPI00263666BE|nr:hypothetical protein [uncultured Pontibacter sp.]
MPDQTTEHITVINSEKLKIHKEPPLPLAVLTLSGYTKSETYKKGINLLLEQTKKDNISHWLINCAKGCSISSEDHWWTSNEIMPAVSEELDLRKIAIIESKNIFNRLSLMALFDNLDSEAQVEIQFFELERNARNWLLENSDLDF